MDAGHHHRSIVWQVIFFNFFNFFFYLNQYLSIFLNDKHFFLGQKHLTFFTVVVVITIVTYWTILN